ncbi:hypothetical protein O181_064075 [Austropuccinia psidii MF-1]|uniref:Uncharacterized protein n=1 Tax=Austropuccinia psidii MF-1 TaxID=1389203 RepID=A0A9Q3ESH7_9BASI|nr:hypothetical protein [Austropuccinia psidii MF-1]
MVELPSFPSFEWEFLVIDTPKGEDLILRFEFHNNFNPAIDWRQGLITLDSDHNDYYYASKSSSNDISFTKSCAALVGDSRTPSFPSSVHIPSPNSHMSLLFHIVFPCLRVYNDVIDIYYHPAFQYFFLKYCVHNPLKVSWCIFDAKLHPGVLRYTHMEYISE